jgi:hypothetical protein
MSKLIRIPNREASFRILMITLRVLNAICSRLRDSLAVFGVLFIVYLIEQGYAWSPIICIFMVSGMVSSAFRVFFTHGL